MKKAINIIITALLVVSMAAHVMNIVTRGGELSLIIVDVAIVVLCILVLYYNFWGYKKPHGNLLRYLFMIFGFIMIINAFLAGKSDLLGLILTVIGAIIIYMSGRLNKIEKNKVLTIVVLILFVAFVIMNALGLNVSFGAAQSVATEMPPANPSAIPKMSFLTIPGIYAGPFQWLALSLAYTSRYAAHKEAGLEDKPKA